MSLLDRLLAVHATPASVDTVSAPVDADYAAYLAEVEAGNARRAASCRRCGGAGYLREYTHINGGVCFSCGGASARVDAPMSYREWLTERAISAGFEGFDVTVQE